MKTSLFCLSLALASTASVSLAQSASTAPVSKPAAVPHQASAPEKRSQARCTPQTGSRINRSAGTDGTCKPSDYASRSYSADDVKRTGATDIGSALENLDPGIRR